MALIPPDAGVRLRMQTEASLQPITPVKGTGIDLPQLQTGQTFTARILEVLPEKTYRALIAGQQMTLSLPEGAAAGDSLELVVIDRTPKLIIAQTAAAAAENAAAGPAPNTTLSAAARLIGTLLPSDGERAPPAELARGQPVLARPPANGTELAPMLDKAVSRSGLFYESHQAQWVAGRLPLNDLLQEPQGQHSPITPPPARAEAAENAAPRPGVVATTAAPTEPGKAAARSEAAATTASAAGAQNEPPPPKIADELRPLVQQQLDAVATQRLAWHGEIWPGQHIDWEIRWEEQARPRDTPDQPADSWSTTVSLTTPRLGRIDAALQLAGGGVRIHLATPYGASAADLRDAAPALAAALEAAGVPLLGMQVKHEEA